MVREHTLTPGLVPITEPVPNWRKNFNFIKSQICSLNECLFIVHAVNSPGEDPLSCGRSHEHQQQPQASHFGSVSGAVSGGARMSGISFSSPTAITS